ncbi:hypothetical protein [Dactylosporangium sp. CA-139066]|uniref:hypothetical protein n=1 Tax=Dactylosporangium sp. CA-139066 TaxID=3239930 RepID=UPI003D8EDC26
MARVRSFGPSTQNVKVHPTEVDCEYKTISDDAGQRYLHLSTFGSDEREAERKSSQSLQLDLIRCRELLAILEMEFPTLSDRADSALPTNTGPIDSPELPVPDNEQNSNNYMTATLVEAAAKIIADELKANVQSRQWDAVLLRTAELLRNSTKRQ